MEEEKALREKHNLIRSRLGRARSVTIKNHPTGNSVMEAVFSRGDRRLGAVLIQAWNRGARFDSWKDRFDFSRWEESFSAEKIDYRSYLGPLDKAAVLPWDHLETGIKKAFLLSELEKALKEERTASCLDSDCALCRGCDSPLRRPGTPRQAGPASLPKLSLFGTRTDRESRYEVFYAKSGLARFLSHRDLTNHLQRSLRRAGVEVAHSSGFHPKMLVTYAPALPLGMRAREDCFEFRSFYRMEEGALLERLNRSARPGIRFLHVRRVDSSEAPLSERIRGLVYSLDLADGALRAALERRKAALGMGHVDDLDFVRQEMERFLEGHEGGLISVRVECAANRLYLQWPALSRRGLRPQDVVGAVFGLDNASPRLTRERLVFGPSAEVPGGEPRPD
jgi:radical SAM-linked protein